MIYFLVYVQIPLFPLAPLFFPSANGELFNSTLSYSLINILFYTANVPIDGWLVILVGMMKYVPAVTLVPWFILTLRELYACEVQNSYESDIDTAFGFGLVLGHSAAASVLMFAHPDLDEGLEWGDDMDGTDGNELC